LIEQRFLRRQTRRVQDEIGATLPAQLGGPVDEAPLLGFDADVQRLALVS
jgi:hypothetical protein